MPMAPIVSQYIYINNLFFVIFIIFIKPLHPLHFLFMTHSCHPSIIMGSLIDKTKNHPILVSAHEIKNLLESMERLLLICVEWYVH